MTKKKSKKKISKKQKSMKEGFTQAKEEQEKENPQKYDPAQKTGHHLADSKSSSGANSGDPKKRTGLIAGTCACIQCDRRSLSYVF